MKHPLTDTQIASKRKQISDRAYRYAHQYWLMRGRMVPLYLLSRRLGKLCASIDTDTETVLRSDERFELYLNPQTEGLGVLCVDFDLNITPTHPIDV